MYQKKNIFKKYKEIGALLLLAILVSIYTYHKNTPVEESELLLIEGTLREKPFYGEQGGDMPEPYIRITINENEKRYFLMWCSYSAAQTDKVLGLTKNSSIEFWIKKEDKNKRKADIFRLISNEEKYLHLGNYNYCYTHKWRGLLIFIKLFFGVIIVLIIYDVYNWIRNK
jgi:hypothetical protein